MEVYAGLPGAHRPPRRPADRRAGGPRGPRRHARLLHHRRQRRVGRGHDQRHLQRDDEPQRRGRARDAPSSWRPRSTCSATPERVQPLRGRLGARDGHAVPVDQAGRLALGRDPQRHDRPLAQRHRRARRGPHAVPPRHRRRADGARSRRAARADVRPRRAADARSRAAHALRVRRRRRAASATTDAVLRDVRATAASTTRAGRRSPATARRGSSARRCRRSTTTSGSSTTPTDWTQAHDLAAEQPEKLAELQRLFLIEAATYNVLPLDDRRVERFNPDLAGRPVADPGQLAAPVRRHGPAVRELGDQHQEQVARGHGRGRGPRGRARRASIIAQGGAFGGWSPVPARWPAGVLLQPVRPAPVQGLRPGRRARRRPPGAAWSSRTTAAGWARAAPSRLYVDGAKVGEGRVDATQPMMFSGDETTDVGSDTGSRGQRRLPPRDEPVHRHGPLGPDRPRRGRRRRRPPHHARGAAARRDGPPVASAWWASA